MLNNNNSEPLPPTFEDINFSSTAFAEDSCELEHAHGNVWTVKRRTSSDPHEDSGDDLSEFGELHLNQGLDGIVRLDPHRKKRASLCSSSSSRCVWWWWGLLTVALTAVAVTTVSLVRVPAADNNTSNSNENNNAYDDTVQEIYHYLISHGVSSESNLRSVGSPHYEALHWMAVHPGSSEVGSEPFLARYVMALTFFALEGPLFVFDAPLCEWFRKDDSDSSPGIECDEQGLPVALYFGKWVAVF